MPQSYFSGIIQDKDGFLWFSTLDCFSRYDGKGFKTIHYNPKDSTGLAANTIIGLDPVLNNTVTVNYGLSHSDNFDLSFYKVTPNTINDKITKIPNALWQTYHIS